MSIYKEQFKNIFLEPKFSWRKKRLFKNVLCSNLKTKFLMASILKDLSWIHETDDKWDTWNTALKKSCWLEGGGKEGSKAFKSIHFFVALSKLILLPLSSTVPLYTVPGFRPVLLRTVTSKCHQAVASFLCHPSCLLPTSHSGQTTLGNEVLWGTQVNNVSIFNVNTKYP